MYDEFWGLRANPFKSDASRTFFHLSPSHDEAAARLDYLIDNRRRLGLVVGESGTGKTSLFHWYAGQLRRRQHEAQIVSLLGLDLHEFLWQIASALFARPQAGDSQFAIWRRITDRLLAHRYGDQQVVMFFDDADEASREVIDCIIRLIHIEPTPRLQLTVVLAGEPERALRLGKRVLDHLELHIELDAWTVEDTEEYLQHALASVGREDRILSGQAVERLVADSEGNPRRIAQIADLALLAGAAQQATTVGPELIAEVSDELLQQRSVAPV